MMRDHAHVRSLVVWFSLVISYVSQLGCLQEAPTPSVERGIALLIPLLHDPSAELRRTAAESLGKIGDRSTANALIPLLADPMPSVRTAAAQALGRIADSADEAVIIALTRGLQDPSHRVKQVAALAIAEIEPSPRQLRPVADLLRAPDVQVRRAAVRALLVVETRPFLEALLPLMDDPDVDVRQGAVAAVSLSGDPRAAAVLEKRLAQDPSPAVRAEAAHHLGQVSGGAILTRLQAKESDPGVRRWIEEGLKELRVND